MWRQDFLHEIAFGLLSVFIPLYVVTFQDTSLLGVLWLPLPGMISIALFCTILPHSSGLYMYVIRQYKLFILLSFLSSAIILFFHIAICSKLLVFLYVLMQVLHVALKPQKHTIAEHYSREEWEGSFAFHEGFTEIGSLIGLGIGLFARFCP